MSGLFPPNRRSIGCHPARKGRIARARHRAQSFRNLHFTDAFARSAQNARLRGAARPIANRGARVWICPPSVFQGVVTPFRPAPQINADRSCAVSSEARPNVKSRRRLEPDLSADAPLGCLFGEETPPVCGAATLEAGTRRLQPDWRKSALKRRMPSTGEDGVQIR